MRTRLAMTMIELLVTLMIISILASAVLFSMQAAQEAARRSRTQAIMATVQNALADRWDSFAGVRAFNVSNPSQVVSTRFMVSKQEFPDTWEEIRWNYENTTEYNRPVSVEAYYGFYQRSKNHPNFYAFEESECLYLILCISCLQSHSWNWLQVMNGMTADTDGDGAKEIVDGWGEPIKFIRWPTGFTSAVQTGFPGSVPVNSPEMLAHAKNWHHPFDPHQKFPHAYYFSPLVVSSGPDRKFEIFKNVISDRTDPYAPVIGFVNGIRRDGEPYDENLDGELSWADNIDNHSIH